MNFINVSVCCCNHMHDHKCFSPKSTNNYHLTAVQLANKEVKKVKKLTNDSNSCAKKNVPNEEI